MMVVSDDDGPDFVDELEAELAARRPVPVQQDEPEGADEDLQREIESTRRALKGGMWLTSHGLLRARVRSAVNQMASTGLLPATRVKLEAALAVDVARGVPQKPCPVPVQQDEPEGVCAFPNCSCTENRCPAKGERGPFCDHGFHPRLCGRCAPVPEAVTDEDEVQCQMCKTVQPRPDKECGHCGAGPKYLCPIHTRPAAAPVQQERSVRAPKTDDPHSLPRVDDLLDDIPVQQEPGRYSDRERVADYLAYVQGVEFHDLNDDAQREWLMRASDALRAVWSIGRLVDADDGYEVMCEPVAAMVEEVRAALVPVQQDEPEADSEFFEKGETGEPPTEEELAFIRESAEDVYESGLPDIEAVPVQQEPERSALGSDEDFRNAVKAYPPLAVSSVGLRDRAIDAALATVSSGTWSTRLVVDAVLSVVMAGNDELVVESNDDEQTRHNDLRGRIARALYHHSGANTDWREQWVRDGWMGQADAVLSVLHEAGTQGDGGLVHSLAVALMTATTEAQEGIKPSDEALRHRDALVQRARAAGEGQRQHREMFDTFAPTEPTIDDLQRSPAEAGTQGDWQQARTVRHLLDRIIDGSMANGPTDEDINSAESVTGWIAVASPGPAEAGTQEGENA